MERQKKQGVCSLEALNGYGDLEEEKYDTEETVLCKLYEAKVREGIAQLAKELTERWLKKYEGVMRICNYTVGQADADNLGFIQFGIGFQILTHTIADFCQRNRTLIGIIKVDIE